MGWCEECGSHPDVPPCFSFREGHAAQLLGTWSAQSLLLAALSGSTSAAECGPCTQGPVFPRLPVSSDERRCGSIKTQPLGPQRGQKQVIPSSELPSRIPKALVGLYHHRSASLHLPIMGVWTVLGEGSLEEGR